MPLFLSRVQIIGINPYVTPPPAVLKALFIEAGRETSPIPVHGVLAKGPAFGKSAKFRQTLVRYQGAWRLYLNGPMREATGVAVGSRVCVTIAFDPSSRKVAPPPAFARALRLPKNAKALRAFRALTPSHQKELNRYLGFAKTQATLTRNIDIIIDWLNGGKPRGLAAVRREKR